MAAIQEFRARTLRFLGGDFRSSDLDYIFLYLRDHQKKLNSIKDIGDFIAHKNKRYKGLSWERLKWTYDGLRIVCLSDEDRRKLNISAIKNHVIGVLRLSDPVKVKKETGYDYGVCKNIIEGLMRKSKSSSNGLLVFERGLSKKEITILNYFSCRHIVNQIYSREEILSEFEDSLNKQLISDNSLLEISEEAKDFLIIWISVLLNAASAEYQDGEEVSVFMKTDEYGDIALSGRAVFPWNGGKVTIDFPFLFTRCKANDWLHPNLCVNYPDGFLKSNLEINENRKVCAIQ